MPGSSADYFALIACMRKDGDGSNALNSLDIIDAKAGGLAGLIGGFSAASTFILQSLGTPGVPGMDVVKIAMTVTLLLFCLSGVLCASCLHIMSHHQQRLLEGMTDRRCAEDVALATKRVLDIYDARVTRYLWSLYSFFAGVATLSVGGCYFALG